jgi:hypothetical protein
MAPTAPMASADSNIETWVVLLKLANIAFLLRMILFGGVYRRSMSRI